MSVLHRCLKCNYENQDERKKCPVCGRTLESEELFRQLFDMRILELNKNEKGTIVMTDRLTSMAVDEVENLKVGASMEDLVNGGHILENKYPELKGYVHVVLGVIQRAL